jgi:5-(carboxyamino)imidazole ribonucleotide mutase
MKVASETRPLVAILMGSDSDWPVMQAAARIFDELRRSLRGQGRLGPPHARSAVRLCRHGARPGSCAPSFAGAGGAAHLPGMLAAKTPVPVLGVPVPSKHLSGLDSLLSIVQMPRGIPVATFAIGEAGAANAALFAVAMLATRGDEFGCKLVGRLDDFRQRQTDKALAMQLTGPL